MNLTQLIQKHFIDTIERESASIGVEVELPLVSIKKTPVKMSFIQSLTEYMRELGFIEKNRTSDGYICEMVDKEGNLLSFETTWNTLELSMKKRYDLNVTAQQFYDLLIPIQKFCMENNYYLCGKGINPNSAYIDTAPLKSPVMLAKSQYLSLFTKHHDGEIFHALSASVQTHLDAKNKEAYLKLFCMLRKAYVFDGLLFSNSMPPDNAFLQSRAALLTTNTNTLCYRDELWRNCGAPNLLAVPGDIDDMNKFRNYLEGLKLFIVPEGNGFVPIKPITLTEYFKDYTGTEENLTCFRSLEPIAPTKNGTLEIRSTCMQPLDTLFEAPAFYLGLAANSVAGAACIDDIYRHHFSDKTPLTVRDELMMKSNAALRISLKECCAKLLTIASRGLEKRGYGEERLILPLLVRYQKNDFKTPAELDKGDALEDTVVQMRNIERSYINEY